MQDLKQKVLENLKNKGYHEYQLKELNPIIQATIEATKKALNVANVSGGARFIIVAESVSGHCCFEYSVIDTKEGKETYGDYWKKTMCETFDKDAAVMICYALNQHCC